MEDLPHNIRQGFICPFCMDDLGSYPTLAAHVESDHPEATTGVAEQLKGFIQLAKRNIKKLDSAFDIESFRQIAAQKISSANSSSANLEQQQSSSAAEPAPRQRSKYTIYGCRQLALSRSREREHRQAKRYDIPVLQPEIGVTRSFTDYYTKCRDFTVNDVAVKTNALIIRMDKLINEAPADPKQRRAFERQVVPWRDDANSPTCTGAGCTSKFNMARRRHHCRLCGRVICNACSRFLSFLSARKLTNPALAAAMQQRDDEATTTTTTTTAAAADGGAAAQPNKAEARSIERIASLAQRTGGQLLGLWAKASRDPSETSSADGVSLGTLLRQDAAEQLRVCADCLDLLEKREAQMEASNHPVLVSYYDRLKTLLNEISNLAPSFSRVAASINNGETLFSLKEADELRSRIALKQREIDALSKNIEAEGDASIGFRETQLRRNIRLVTLQILQEVISGLPALPSAERYAELAEQHRKRVAKQVEQARERVQRFAAAAPKVSSSAVAESVGPPLRTSSSFVGRIADDGWTADISLQPANPFAENTEERHPLLEQRDIIKAYLSQAAAAGRLEEVNMLERSLKDLEDEMRQCGLEPFS